MNPRTLGRSLILPLAAVAALGAAAHDGEPNAAQVGFENGAEGWSLNGWDTVTPTGGNPDARLHWDNFVDTFGMSARTDSHAAFVGDYTAKGPVQLSIDFQVEFIQFFGTPVSRDLVVILFDDDSFGGAPPAAVWTQIGTLDGNGMDWTTFRASVTDVMSDELPAGWNGAGDEDPVTFEPILPAGRTWTNVLQGIDRIEFTTFVPGWFFGFTFFNLSIDNVSIAPVPSAWTDEGHALAGVAGDPALVGAGTLEAGSSNSVDLSGAAPAAIAGLFVGTSAALVPFKGGTLVPSPLGPPIVVATGADGSVPIDFVMPAGVPSGTELWLQWAIQDAAAVHGVALSNAIKGLVP
jgi:hypothetical protein